ncbi:DUF2130 domain-containing protein [Candidatus Roizmanbacteria bacterium CG10_big_fil_rev_8_21_14_0_10_45_7]|uniref:DUF2130 domain-containing protein n=1 Tax=Candidatus Roizmanbacteria bacterium CG10_big_fil_rev_8_21_14_0_10_45_7 TaxID=1974854 RepID=A0A2M8KV33_9BACT|nr:MAG: DUF2130 domain-containing protein [Candidatus Roizmanbacteria bacterium CG10_big_fil_rev_8_21_14_0_10_45_7]
MATSVIICPNCNKPIELSDAVSNEVKQKLWKQAQMHAAQEADKKHFEEKERLEKQLREAQAQEVSLRKERRVIEEEKRSLQVTIERRLDEQRKQVEEAALKRAFEEHKLREREMEKKLQDAVKSNEELRRKLEQGSQQTQGEVLELELESVLKRSFPLDTIKEVPKGVNGADIIQEVYDRSGRRCGTIIWELKRTKSWSEGWIAKLKEDQRTVRADVAVLVSEALPTTLTAFGNVQGVWVCTLPLVVGVATALRMSLQQVAFAQDSQVGKKEKMDILYQYVTGITFKQRVEAIVESFASMKMDLDKEKRAFTKMWAKREKQIETVINNTVGMHGELQGMLGAALPELKSGELDDVDNSLSEDQIG